MAALTGQRVGGFDMDPNSGSLHLSEVLVAFVAPQSAGITLVKFGAYSIRL